jgi:hypothetical protein
MIDWNFSRQPIFLYKNIKVQASWTDETRLDFLTVELICDILSKWFFFFFLYSAYCVFSLVRIFVQLFFHSHDDKLLPLFFKKCHRDIILVILSVCGSVVSYC